MVEISTPPWLPLKRGDYGIDVILRLYVPDLEKFTTWTPPKKEIHYERNSYEGNPLNKRDFVMKIKRIISIALTLPWQGSYVSH